MLKGNSFYVLLVLAGLAAAYGYWAWRVDPYLVGAVEQRRHALGPADDGRIREILVSTGAPVSRGQTLVRLDISDLAAERGLLQEQLAALEAIAAADRQRLVLEYDLLRLRISGQWASVRADLAELEALERQIKVLREAEAAGLGQDAELARMLIKRQALRQSVSEQRAFLGGPVEPASPVRAAAVSDTGAALVYGECVNEMHETRRLLCLVEQRIEQRTVRAPCEGRVVEINARVGNTVEANSPVITVEDTAVAYVDAYIPETRDTRVEVGQAAEIYSRRSPEAHTTGHVSFVHPGFAPMPERLWVNGRIVWGRKLRVQLVSGHSLLPGESVRVRILKQQPEQEAGQGGSGRSDSQSSAHRPGAVRLTPQAAAKGEADERESHAGRA